MTLGGGSILIPTMLTGPIYRGPCRDDPRPRDGGHSPQFPHSRKRRLYHVPRPHAWGVGSSPRDGRAVVGPRRERRGGGRQGCGGGDPCSTWGNVVTGVFLMARSTAWRTVPSTCWTVVVSFPAVQKRSRGRGSCRVSAWLLRVGEVAVRCGGQSSHTTTRSRGRAQARTSEKEPLHDAHRLPRVMKSILTGTGAKQGLTGPDAGRRFGLGLGGEGQQRLQAWLASHRNAGLEGTRWDIWPSSG